MNERVKRLSEQIRKLSLEEQADLLDDLLARAPDPRIDMVWTEEAERRLAALKAGETTAQPLDEVMTELRSRFARKL
jgi:putative addiction module component (TIGR02574 family)